jgi:phenylacetate-CoA ligase
VELSVRQRGFLEALSQTEHLPAEKLQSYQLGLLEPLVRHAAANVPFYRDRLRPVLAGDGTLDFSRWHAIPLFDRITAQAAGDTLQTGNLPVGNDRWVEDLTAGSTGVPLRHRRSNLTDLASRCQSERDYNWYGMDLGKCLAHIGDIRDGTADPADGTKLNSWSLSGDGNFIVLNRRTDIEQQILWLQRMRPRYLFAYPSIVRDLADYALSSGLALWFEVVLTTGEPLSQDVRAKTQKAFGARIYDRYGLQEIGHLAAECPSCGQYHLSAESALVEILREDGVPAEPGEIGRLVVTSLYNYAMPFIRYDVGDFAEVSWSNACWYTLPSLRRILGRERNSFVRPDGSRMWPDSLAAELPRFLGFRQIQIVQTTRAYKSFSARPLPRHLWFG